MPLRGQGRGRRADDPRRPGRRAGGHAIEEFPVDPATIYEMTVAGNATMRDLFFRKDVSSIGQSPHRSITEIDVMEGRQTSTSLPDTSRRCLLPIHPKARVYGLPLISGHVGADSAAACAWKPRRRPASGWPSKMAPSCCCGKDAMDLAWGKTSRSCCWCGKAISGQAPGA